SNDARRVRLRKVERMRKAVRRIDPTRYKRLLSQTMPVIIETEEENERMLKVIEKLMDKGEGLSPEEEKLLKLLTRLVEDFEERFYHPGDATPLEVLQHLMESREISRHIYGNCLVQRVLPLKY